MDGPLAWTWPAPGLPLNQAEWTRLEFLEVIPNSQCAAIGFREFQLRVLHSIWNTHVTESLGTCLWLWISVCQSTMQIQVMTCQWGNTVLDQSEPLRHRKEREALFGDLAGQLQLRTYASKTWQKVQKDCLLIPIKIVKFKPLWNIQCSHSDSQSLSCRTFPFWYNDFSGEKWSLHQVFIP